MASEKMDQKSAAAMGCALGTSVLVEMMKEANDHWLKKEEKIKSRADLLEHAVFAHIIKVFPANGFATVLVLIFMGCFILWDHLSFWILFGACSAVIVTALVCWLVAKKSISTAVKIAARLEDLSDEQIKQNLKSGDLFRGANDPWSVGVTVEVAH